MVDVSVVMICRNQEENIGRLIESVLQETDTLSSREIILVDSASTDQTIEIASRYPIRIIRLHPGQHLSSHAGRYIGYTNTTGEFVLFLDGDMSLYTGWLARALPIMREQPDVASITGLQIYLLPDQTPETLTEMPEPVRVGRKYKDLSDDLSEVEHGGGPALYRRAVLEQVGPFNPYLSSHGEPELCLRIRHTGYRILRIESPIAYHYRTPGWAISEIIDRRRRRLYLGYGEAMRLHFGTDLFWPYIQERGYGCLPALWILTGALSLVWSLLTRRWLWARSWAMATTVALAAYTYKQKNITRAIAGIIFRILIIEGFVRGFLNKPGPPETYQPTMDIVKWVD
jgi:glycosyltransferase involved in cell wall biosynthesis